MYNTVFFMNRSHHFQTNHCCAIFTDDNVFNIIRLIVTIHKNSPQSFAGTIDWIDHTLTVAVYMFKSKCLKIHIFLCRQNAKETLI